MDGKKKLLITADDGIGGEIDWDYSFLNLDFDITRVSLSNDGSGMGSAIDIGSKDFNVKKIDDGWWVAGLRPVSAVNWAMECFGPFDCVLVGPNRGLNVGENVFSSSTMAMATRLAMIGCKAVTVSLETTRKRISNHGSEILSNLLALLYRDIQPGFLVSVNMTTHDPAFAKKYCLMRDEWRDIKLYSTLYNKIHGPEWSMQSKQEPKHALPENTIIFDILNCKE